MNDPRLAEWVRGLKRREAWAWERLQQESLEPVFAYVYLRVPRREDAEDITAEVFAAAAVSIDRFRGDARVETWLIGIARRKLIDAARRKGRRPELLEADLSSRAGDAAAVLAGAASPVESPEGALERKERTAEVRRAVLQLPEAQREALWLRCVHGLSLEETARVLRRSENAVKGLLRRAKTSVLERLGAAEAPAHRAVEQAHVESNLSTPLAAHRE